MSNADLARMLREVADNLERTPDTTQAAPSPPRPPDQWHDGEWWTASEFCHILSGDTYWLESIDCDDGHFVGGSVQFLNDSSYCCLKHWKMVRKYPDRMTADELVKLDLKGATATLRNGVSVTLVRNYTMGGEHWWNFGWSGVQGESYYALDRTPSAPAKPQDILSISIPTSHGPVVYRCEDGVCTRVRLAQDGTPPFEGTERDLQGFAAEPWVPQVGDVVCPKNDEQDELQVTRNCRGRITVADEPSFDLDAFRDTFKLVRRGGGQ